MTAKVLLWVNNSVLKEHLNDEVFCKRQNRPEKRRKEDEKQEEEWRNLAKQQVKQQNWDNKSNHHGILWRYLNFLDAVLWFGVNGRRSEIPLVSPQNDEWSDLHIFQAEQGINSNTEFGELRDFNNPQKKENKLLKLR